LSDIEGSEPDWQLAAREAVSEVGIERVSTQRNSEFRGVVGQAHRLLLLVWQAERLPYYFRGEESVGSSENRANQSVS
jgi:hypothetical protein